MDLDNDEVAYTRYFREINAYKLLKSTKDYSTLEAVKAAGVLKKFVMLEGTEEEKKMIDNIDSLFDIFRKHFNKKVSQKAKIN